MGWFIAFIIVLILGCFLIYHEAEVHELHKMRAAFSDIKERIEHVKAEYNKHQKENNDSFESGELEGELKEIDEVIKIVDTEIENVKIK